MNRIKIKGAAVAALFVLSGCSGTSDPAAGPADGTAPDTSSASTPALASPTTSSSSSSSPAVSTSPTASSPAGSASASTTGAAMTEACRQVVADQEVALTAVAEYAQQPGNVDVANIEAARDRLRGDLANVPAEIQPHVQTQVDTLSNLIDGLRTGNPSNVDVNQLRDAAQQVVDMCQTNR